MSYETFATIPRSFLAENGWIPCLSKAGLSLFLASLGLAGREPERVFDCGVIVQLQRGEWLMSRPELQAAVRIKDGQTFKRGLNQLGMDGHGFLSWRRASEHRNASTIWTVTRPDLFVRIRDDLAVHKTDLTLPGRLHNPGAGVGIDSAPPWVDIYTHDRGEGGAESLPTITAIEGRKVYPPHNRAEVLARPGGEGGRGSGIAHAHAREGLQVGQNSRKNGQQDRRPAGQAAGKRNGRTDGAPQVSPALLLAHDEAYLAELEADPATDPELLERFRAQLARRRAELGKEMRA